MQRKKSFKLRNLIYLLTGICVLSFQCWWLYDGYQLRRKALLDRVSTEAQQFLSMLLIQQLAPKLSVDGPGSSKIDLSGIIGKEKYSRADTQKLLAAQRELTDGASSISVNIRAPLALTNLRPDSLLYDRLRSIMPELGGSHDLTVYFRNGSVVRSVPAGRPVQENASTDWIDTETHRYGSLRVHVNGIFWKILPDMKLAVLFSAVYLCLFLWTILALLRTARENLRLMESKSNFTQNMTHELKIPISGLFLATEALERFNDVDDHAKARRHIATMRNALHQLSALVDRILNSARLEQRQVRLQRTVVALNPLLNSICADMAPVITAAGATVAVESLPESASVYADPEQLRYVFYNLIDNAIKYTAGSARIEVRLHVEAAAHIIEVEDNGIGISSTYQQKVFEAYFRIPQDDRHDVKGYGLGLSIVQQIITLHGGTIRITRSGPGGTTFQIRLPRYDAQT